MAIIDGHWDTASCGCSGCMGVLADEWNTTEPEASADGGADTTSASSSLSVGTFFSGSLDVGETGELIEINLVAGETYTFAMVGIGGGSAGVRDPRLYLRDEAGTILTEDDDGGPGRNSSITFTATSTGTYYLDPQSYNNSSSGEYGVSMALGDMAVYNAEMGAGNLIRSGLSWSDTPASEVEVTWSIRESGTEPSNGSEFVALSAAQVDAVEAIMAYADAISGLSFTQVEPGGTSNDASIVYGSYSVSDGSGAYAYFPGSTASGSNAGDVWLNNTQGSTTSLPIGSYSYFTVLHELGHALGLSHPGDYNAAPGVSITYGNNAQFIQDSHQYSIMSYFGEGNTTTNVSGYPDTFMLYDILALHELYGADTTFHAGDTVYGFNATVGGAYDFTANTSPLLTIWDGAGTDTIDLSSYNMDQVLNLIDGVFSDIGGYIGNMSIAIGAVIENGIGGTGNDEINGNAVSNTLTGGAGDDTLSGGAGNDVLVGDLGDDNLTGGADDDLVIYDGDYADYVVTWNADGSYTIVSNRADDAGTDQLVEIETVSFADGDVVDGTFTADVTQVTVNDTNGNQSWANYVDTFNASGQRTERTMTFDDGLVVNTTYENGQRAVQTRTDATDLYSWSSFVQTFDAAGDTVERTYVFDTGIERVNRYEDGSLTSFTLNDMQDDKSWSSITDSFDISGDRTSRTVVQDDGRVINTSYSDGVKTEVETLDLTDMFIWSTNTQTFEPDGSLATRELVYDDGHRQIIEYENSIRATLTATDTEDAFDWSSYVIEYDAGGNRVSRAITYDDGSEVFTDFLL